MSETADIATVTALVRQSGTSFYRGMKILEPQRRGAMYGIYAFCRVVDDIADDDAAPLAEKHAALEAWRQRIAGLYAGVADDAITRVLRNAVNAYDLQQTDFIAIIDGMEMDAGAPIIAPSLAELDLYCDRVAAAVGRLSVRVFGDASQAAQTVAYTLGRALQLTNILRDIGEDAARGRLYLPREYLDAAGILPDPQAALHAAALPQLCARLAASAEDYFDQADRAMQDCDHQAMRPARLMAASYRPLLKQMRAVNFAHPERRSSLPKWRKLLLAAQILLP